MAADMDLYKTLAADIVDSAKNLIKRARFNTTVKGRVTASLGAGNYEVSINGSKYQVKSRFSHVANDVVVIVRCNNSWSDLYVIY